MNSELFLCKALTPLDLQFKRQVTKAFQGAATSYDHHGTFQKSVAEKLAVFILSAMNSHPNPPASILEIGCGTGFLTTLLQETFPKSFYCLTDRSTTMVQHCQSKAPTGTYLVMDGELPCFNHSWDWIVSSLTMQWFSDLETSLKQLWDQTERLAFSIILDGSLKEWEMICHQQNISSKLQKFISIPELETLCKALTPKSFAFHLNTHIQTFEDVLSFLRHLKGVGAHTPTPHKMNQSLKSIIQRAPHPFTVSYQVAYCILEK